MSLLKVDEHRVLALPYQQDRADWNNGGWDYHRQFVWDAAWLRQVSDNEPGHIGQGLNRSSEILAGRLVEVEQDREVVALPQFLSQGIEHRLALRREAAEDQHGLGGDGVDGIADLLIVEKQVDKLRDLDAINGDLGPEGVEPGFRDTKDLRFGLGAVRIADPQRRDRLLLLNAFAVVLLTLLGAAGESLGMDRHLKSNTVKTRSHSLFRQGSTLYDLIPNMPEHRLRPLVDRFAELLQQSRAFTETFAVT
jgi:hypothetical protein